MHNGDWVIWDREDFLMRHTNESIRALFNINED